MQQNTRKRPGVIISDDLKMKKQCVEAANNSNKILGMMGRWFTYHRETTVEAAQVISSSNSEVLYASIEALQVNRCDRGDSKTIYPDDSWCKRLRILNKKIKRIL